MRKKAGAIATSRRSVDIIKSKKQFENREPEIENRESKIENPWGRRAQSDLGSLASAVHPGGRG